MFDNNDFKGYRNLLGFNSQNAFKEFLGAKDIQPCVDFNDLNALKKGLLKFLALLIVFIVLNIMGMNWNAFLKTP
ncbi:hypothetical protein HMPREF1434_01117 [Helicobacter pylori GAMchJs124i]|nr:hypothetical protein HMPREF1434_01117 [Helicobacter pylori GAMchJs124i]